MLMELPGRETKCLSWEKEKDPKYQKSLNNNNLMCSPLTLCIFSMTVFNISLNLDIHLVQPTFINCTIPGYSLSPLLSPDPFPRPDSPHMLTEFEKQRLPQGQSILLEFRTLL